MDITIFYRPGVVCDQHNHRPTEHLEGHAYVRRLSDDEFCLVEELTWKNVPPREILSTLKDQDETNLSTLPTIYEAQKKIREVERDMKTPMQELRWDKIRLFHPYISISSLQDVKPDGNCGFRSVALGLGLPEDHWPRIRSDLVRQLESRQHQYRSIFGTRGYNQIYSSVRLAGEWMDNNPTLVLVIASAYNKLVVSLSNDGGCATSFPLWSSPPQSDSNEIIVIAYVNGDHYIRFGLRRYVFL
ncbi:MEI2-like protein 2 [Tanacetum coccineum]